MIELNEEQEKEFKKLMKGITASRVVGNSNYGESKVDYLRKLLKMDIQALKKITKDMIWLSAYANNNPKSDYHYQCDLCYDVCEIRDEELYERLHTQAVKENA